MQNKHFIKVHNVYFPLDNHRYIKKKKKNKLKKIKWIDNKKKHNGLVLASQKNFKIIECKNCEFNHCVPIPTETKLKMFYNKKYYNQKRKNDYFKKQKKDLAWWKSIFLKRLNQFEKMIKKKGTILDIGCGPGFFINYAKSKGWKVVGIEPSIDAVNFAKKELKLKVHHGDYKILPSLKLKNVDVIYTHGVLEHLRDPKELFIMSKKYLSKNGIFFTSVANDFNLFQAAALKKIKKPWWIVAPEHINYFSIKSIFNLFKKTGYKVLEKNSSFPLEIFLLMNENYVQNPNLGKKIHNKRIIFEKSLKDSGLSELNDAYLNALSNLGIGRQIDMIGCKKR